MEIPRPNPPVIGGLCLFIFAILAYLILLLTQRPI